MEEEKLLTELKQIRNLLAEVVGTQDLPKREQFSKDALTKAASEFRNLQIERGEWIPEHDISKVIRSAPYGAAKFIVDKFDFKNYFIRGRKYYLNRKDLMALNLELKKRKINLKTYIDLEEDKEKFHKYLEQLRQGKMKRPHFKMPEELRDINSQPYNHPPKEKIINQIDALREEYEKSKLAEFIDIFQNDYAMVKHLYYFDRFLDPDKKKQYAKWCFEFNYVQNALKEIKKIKSQVNY